MRSIRVAETKIESFATISTIQLPPIITSEILFETMIFPANEGAIDYQVRSTTRDDALLAHMDAIAVVLKWIEQ